MTNGTKILCGIIIIALILTVLSVAWSHRTVKENIVENDTINEFFNQYVEVNNNEVEDDYENNIIEENAISEKTDEVSNEKKDNEFNSVQNTFVGKEETENNNIQTDNKENAIKLAQEEWGISINSYDFEAEEQSDGTYQVTVRNKTNRNVITIYIVDTKLGTVVEE